MSKNLGLKALILSIFSIITTSLASAGLAGDWTILDSGASSFADAANAVTWYEIGTLPELGFFIAIFVATYAVTLKFVDLIWGVMTERINIGSSDRYSISHENGTSGTEKILSAALAFVAAQYIGMLIGPILGSAVLLLMSMVAITILMIFYWFIKGPSTRSDGGRVSSAASSVANIPGIILERFGSGRNGGDGDPDGDASEAEEAEEDAREHEERAEGEMGAAEEDASSGDTETAGREAEAAVEDMKAAIKDMDIAASDIEHLMNTEHEQLERTLNELSATLDLENEEQTIIQDIKQQLDEAENIVRGEILPRMEAGELDMAHPATIMGGVDGAEIGLNNVSNYVRTLSEDVQKLRNDVAKEREEVDTEVSELLMEVRELASAHQLIQRLKREDEIGYKIDEEIENFAKALNSKELYEEAEYEEKEEDKLRNEIQKMLSDEPQIIATLEKAESILGKIDEMDLKEGEEIRSEINEIEDLEDALDAIIEGLSDRDIAIPDEVKDAVLNIGNYLNNIESQLANINEWKKKEDEEIKKALSQTKSALREIEG